MCIASHDLFALKWCSQITKFLLFSFVFLASCSESKKASPAPAQIDTEIAAFVVQVNQYRLNHSCAELAWDEALANVAQAHSDDMVERGFFSHTNPDGKNPFSRLIDAGIVYSAAAENIAAGANTGDAVLNLWLNSSGHRANIENCIYTKHGVGRKNSEWTHVFLK